MSRLQIIFVLILGAWIYSAANRPSTPTPQVTAKTPEQIAAKAAEDRAFQRTARIAAGIKASLREPGSVVWESIHANEDASIICLDYRARNGFGGMAREFVVFANGKASKKVNDWNRRCVDKGLADMKHVKHAI